MLIYAIVSITSAFIFYTIGVWSEKMQGKLKIWHLIIFYLGLIFDTLGTTIMSKIAAGGFQLNFHGITGLLAIFLMLFHALWATIVLIKNNENAKIKFHKFSISVWIIWLIPFISGAILGMAKS
ncbi:MULTISPECIES: HsmA family protein [unclassified Clostridium]|uniref:HsmA family protein n=1 Tax=unclassified Clostridium TaxID=2614128 RepID=UPI0002979172|nr:MULTISPECIES: HsmA family protein [unclassified Clostridium]EKQ56857.1 MAG: TIGR03987 family protein [Clostridium sp. Maddingley MBC34-26]